MLDELDAGKKIGIDLKKANKWEYRKVGRQSTCLRRIYEI